MPSDLDSLRAQVQQTDIQLLELLCRRARLVTEIHTIKVREGLPVQVPSRERQLLELLLERNPGPLPDEAIQQLFEQIFASSRALQRSLRAE